MPTFDPVHILEVLARHRVDHIVIGGVGGVLHGSPMSTDDVDIVPALRKTNLDALAAALKELNARILTKESPEGIPVEFTGERLQKWIVDFQFLNLTTDYGRLDIIHRPGGTSGYQDLAAHSEELDLGETPIRVAALEDIIRSKQAVSRERDLEQLPTLRKLLERKRTGGLAPGSKVNVPWELDQLEGVITEIRGTGPSAQATVRVRMPTGDEVELPFPLKTITPRP